MRPGRSDAHLSPEEEAMKEEEARGYFQKIAPKRHTKPSRSEHSSVYCDEIKNTDQDSIPEFEKLQNLEADPQVYISLSSTCQCFLLSFFLNLFDDSAVAPVNRN